jgi:hypothetical protein
VTAKNEPSSSTGASDAVHPSRYTVPSGRFAAPRTVPNRGASAGAGKKPATLQRMVPSSSFVQLSGTEGSFEPGKTSSADRAAGGAVSTSVSPS